MIRRTGVAESTQEFVRRVRSGARPLEGVTPIDIDDIAAPIASPPPARAIWQQYGADQITRRGIPWRTEFFRSPRVLREAQLVASAGTALYPPSVIDYPREFRLGAGVVPSRGAIRVLYTDPNRAGGVAEATPQTLRAVDVEARPRSGLGRIVGGPRIVATSNTRGEAVQFFGAEATSFTWRGHTRPLMLAVAEGLADPNDIEYLLVDDIDSGDPVVSPIVGVPRSAPFSTLPSGEVRSTVGDHRIAPGISATPSGEVLMSVAVRGSRGDQLDLVVGMIDLSGAPVRFRETDRVTITNDAFGTGLSGFPMLFESLPLAWHSGIGSWIVMYVVDQWEMRFHVVDSGGRFVSRTPATPMASSENTHSGVDLIVHPETGHVVFKSGHNAITAFVGPDQRWSNIWVDRGFPPIGVDHPPETWPLPSEATVARTGRWVIAPTTFRDWEFQGAGLGLGARPALVSRPFDQPPQVYQGRAAGSLGDFPPAPSTQTGSFGVHRAVRTPFGVTAFVTLEPLIVDAWIKVAFLEDGR